MRRCQPAAPGGDQDPQEKLLRALDQRVQRGGAPRRGHRGPGLAGRQQAECPPAELLPAPGCAVQTGQQRPGVEPRAVPQLDSLQQVTAYVLDWQRTILKRPHIHPQLARHQAQGVAAQQ